ncbi:MAG TPA: Type 1 glutamine amidotransferase-like domain-containing protein [Candidatus Paceibacterota bacterium]
MKLLLTSGGLTNKSIVAALQELAERPFAELSLAFIPTAANLEEGDKWWLIEDLENCKKLGLKTLDIVDISALPRNVWQKRLKEANILFFEGGNTFHLMHWISASGLRELLPELLKTRVYVGVSAGSIVAGLSLALVSTSEREQAEEIHGKIGDNGICMTDFVVKPHINNEHFNGRTFDSVQKESGQAKFPVYALDDQSAIKVVDGEVSVVSEGEWKRFG